MEGKLLTLPSGLFYNERSENGDYKSPNILRASVNSTALTRCLSTWVP